MLGWLSVTFKEEPEGLEQFLSPFVMTARGGHKGYEHSKWGDGAILAWGGNQGTWHLSLSQTAIDHLCEALDPRDIVRWALDRGGRVTRIDLWHDGPAGILDKAIFGLQAGLCVSGHQKYQVIEENRIKGNDLLGKTLYIGSRMSHCLVRMYNQGFRGVDADRCELEWKGSAAQPVAREYAKGTDERRMILGKLRFVADEGAERVQMRKVASWWTAWLAASLPIIIKLPQVQEDFNKKVLHFRKQYGQFILTLLRMGWTDGDFWTTFVPERLNETNYAKLERLERRIGGFGRDKLVIAMA